MYGAQMSAFYAVPPLGMVATGYAVERWGVADTYLTLALALVATSLVVGLSRALRRALWPPPPALPDFLANGPLHCAPATRAGNTVSAGVSVRSGTHGQRYLSERRS